MLACLPLFCRFPNIFKVILQFFPLLCYECLWSTAIVVVIIPLLLESYESRFFPFFVFSPRRVHSASSKFASCIILISTTIYFCTRMRNKTFPRRMDGRRLMDDDLSFSSVLGSFCPLLDGRAEWDDEVEVKNQSRSSFNVTRTTAATMMMMRRALDFQFQSAACLSLLGAKLFLPIHRTQILSRLSSRSAFRESKDVAKASVHPMTLKTALFASHTTRVSCIWVQRNPMWGEERRRSEVSNN